MTCGQPSFGQIIKKLRRDADMTQETLAETLSISGQAVSRWENDLAMPDISLLPTLANLFDVTTDYLLGVDITRKQETIKTILLAAEEDSKQGFKLAAVESLRAGLREYPGSFELMHALQYNLYAYAGQLDRDARAPVLDETIALGEKILAGCTDDKLRHGAIRWLCHVYAERGNAERAEALANTMPEPWLSRPGLLGVIYRGDRQYKAKRNEIVSLISEAISVLETLDVRLDSGEWALDDDERILVAHKALALVDILCEDGNYGGFDAYRADIYRDLFIVEMRRSHIDEAYVHLEKAVTITVALDTTYDRCATHTALLTRGMEYGDFSFSDTDNLSMCMLKMLQARDDFAAVEADPRTRDCLALLQATAATR